MKGIILLFVFFSCSAFSQTIYGPHEVETAAKPSGGEEVLNLFIASNLRIPITSSWKGLNGRVFVKAIIEPNGSPSNLEIIRGIDTLCNAEAIRVASLYHAWQPAKLKGNAVRQSVTIPIVFRAAPIASYDSAQRSLITYFDKRWVKTTKPGDYKYKRLIPLDDFGFMNGDMLFEQKNRDGWIWFASVPFRKEEFWHKIHGSLNKDSIKVVKTTANDEQWNFPSYQVIVRQLNGKILSHSEFTDGGIQVADKSYHLNEVLSELEIEQNNVKRKISWYENGQLASITESPVHYAKPFIYVVNEFYDQNGAHLVKNGNGYYNFEIHNQQGLEGQGAISNGLKQGRWTMKGKDSTLLFDELYEKGILTKGISFFEGKKLEYTEVEVQPEFSGGMPSMYKYLSQNIKYPKDAAKQNIMGRVFTSFVVCEDGSLCDYKILKGLNESIDAEALRVIEGMSGKWQPGWQRGRKVRVKYNLPINFQLR